MKSDTIGKGDNMKKKLGFIGCGNMGEAILSGVVSAGVLASDDIFVYTPTKSKLESIHKKYNIQMCASNREVYTLSDVIILAIKPYQFEDVINEIKEIDSSKVIVSIAAGMTIEKIKRLFDNNHLPVIRVMPNTPVFVNTGASSICASKEVSDDDLRFVKMLFESIGVVEEVEEDLFHAVIATSGSSPAYVFMFIDAIIKEAQKQGLDYKTARNLASYTVLGAAQMVISSTATVEQLKADVCSPNGTTIEAVQVLESEGFDRIIAKAMEACIKKSQVMSE